MATNASKASSPTRPKPRGRRDNAARLGGVAQATTNREAHTEGGTTTVLDGCDTQPQPLVTRRLWRRIEHRTTVFTAPAATIGATLGELADDVRRVYLVGARPGAGTAAGFRSWVYGELPAGWSHDDGGHYLESSAAPALAFTRPNGARVDVHRAASWFGEGDYSVADADDAYELVRALVEARFAGATLLATPATTGRELFVHGVPKGREFPVLSDELQELIRSTSGQHRYDPNDDELAARAGDVAELPGLYEYDARFQYAALAWGLGVGVPLHDHGDAFAGKARARYRITFTVPRDWPYLGLLGVKEGVENWHYPRGGRARHETWCDGAELEVAAAHGWPMTIHERLIWDTGKPLDTWADKLVALRESITGADRVSDLARAAVRMLVLASIGAFHGSARAKTYFAPLTAPRPRGADVSNLRAEGDHWVWTQRGEQGWKSLAHPEWSAAIWARGRRRALDGPTGTRGVRAGVLHTPPAELVAVRADAIYTSSPQPWGEPPAEDGKTGRFRRVRALTGPVPAARSHVELLRRREGR